MVKKYIDFREWKKSPKHKTVMVDIYNIKAKEKIGQIYWDCGWRQYVWFTFECIKWSSDCTQQVVDKVTELNNRKREV